MKIGVISDTHGHIHPGAFDCLKGVDLILHAGDVGSDSVLVELETLAPVKAVSGNTDSFPLTSRLKEKEIITVAGIKLYLTHRFIERGLTLPPVMNDIHREKPDIVVFGHTHQQHAEQLDGIFFFNPGAVGYRRPGTRTGVGLLKLENGKISHKIFYLE